MGKSIDKNNLVSPVICSTTSPSGVEIIYKYKLLIENNNVKKNKVGDWQTKGILYYNERANKNTCLVINLWN